MNKLITFIFLILSIQAVAQESKTISILMNTVDTTYKFVEVIKNEDGDTMMIRYTPEKWLSSLEFSEYIFQIALAAKQQEEEFKEKMQQALAEYEYYRSTIDTIFGPGTYQSIIEQRHLDMLQGSWTLVEITENDRTRHAVTVSGNQITSDTKEAVIGIVDERNINLTGWTQAGVLKFTLRKDGNYFARKGTTKYILIR